ncbi:MAG: Uma2 family endonuclease, partial [Nostocaceae cyanobacterium CSU_2_110]|nr:Uma2 family endonuclease [Nostocaceae cyanobacterium CSU_2_110]
EVESELIAFYREDNAEKLLAPSELAQALKESEEKAERLKRKLSELGIDPDSV